MDVFECMRDRRSIRSYRDIPVEWELVCRIIRAGKAAPCAGNQQNWKFIVVLDKAKRAAISETCLQQYWMQTAPVHIVVIGEPQKAKQYYGVRGERLYTIQSCAAAIQNMLLAAHALGLGGCWIGAFDEDMLKKAVGIPDYVRPQAVVTLGHPAEKPPEPWEYRLYDITHLDKWDRKVKDVNWIVKDFSVTMNKKAKEGADRLVEHGKKAVDSGRKLVSDATQRLKPKQ